MLSGTVLIQIRVTRSAATQLRHDAASLRIFEAGSAPSCLRISSCLNVRTRKGRRFYAAAVEAEPEFQNLGFKRVSSLCLRDDFIGSANNHPDACAVFPN
jgi:hypothetical protein